MAEHHGKTVLYPYLDSRVQSAVSDIPLNDLRPVGDDRKRPLKEIALRLGHPEIAEKTKKAAQYGTGSMNMIKRLAKRKGMTVSEFIGSLKEDA
jgi:asparagine synthase (glutamine-hydrolysing)